MMAVSIFLTKALEHVSTVWLELVLACLAAALYFAQSAKATTPKRSKDVTAAPNPEEPGTMSQYPDKDLTASQLALKAMRQGRMGEAIALIQHSPDAIRRVPTDLACRLLLSIARLPKSNMSAELKVLTGKISSQALDAAIVEAIKVKDLVACRQLHKLSGLLSIPKSQQAFEVLAKVYACDATALRILVEEASTPLARPFAVMVLDASARMKDANLAAEIFEKTSSADTSFLREVVEKVTTPDSSSIETTSVGSSDRSTSPDGLDETSCQKDASISCKEIAMRANDIRSCGKNGDLKGATKVFDRLGSTVNSTLILNSMIDACVECNELDQAVSHFNEAKNRNTADVVSYNTMMKGYIANGQEASAKTLLSELTRKGITATRTSFHGLLNARVNAKDFVAAWKLVAEMQAAGISPIAVTCSILLKGKLSTLADVVRVLSLIDSMDEPMDEVLFLSVVEACIRTGRLDLLSRQTEKFMQQGASANLTAPTYGSMIKAYGYARDVKGVWHLWDQMLFHNVQPTSVTLGCMVEALVGNGRPDEAWQLARKMWDDVKCRPLVNTVVYSSILKGFAHIKDTDKVMALYEEMKAHGIQANTITYNTILNAFAQGNTMQRVPALLEDMKAATPPVEPDIVTYSTIVKGFCNVGNLDRALKVLEDMKAGGKHAPDEVLYNSLLAGCAKEHRPDEAVKLLEDMKKFNVAPSNYTLSMLVKLMGRCRRINQAFTMLEDISREYGLRINVQVYTCLIQGCFNAGQTGKALVLHEKIINEGLIPDAMTYTVLVRGCVQGCLLDKAVELAKCAYGHGPTASKGTPAGLNAGCLDELIAALGNSEGKELMAELGDCQPAKSASWGNKGNAKGSGKGAYRPPTQYSAPPRTPGGALPPWHQRRA